MITVKDRQSLRAAHRPCIGSLIELYEANYRLLARLIPDIHSLEAPRVSVAGTALDLHVELVERGRYTTCINLTYYFEGEGEGHAEPDCTIRLAHDAKSAELLSFRAEQPVEVQGRPQTISTVPGASVLDWKWQANNLLLKWLHYCLETGHRFPVTAAGVPAHETV